eukprot:1934857-Pyramimonas_sp.AAC.1
MLALRSKGRSRTRTRHGANCVKIASQGGARPLHRVTKVRAIPSPEIALGVQSGKPVVIVVQEVDMYRKLWSASEIAAPAWEPDRTTRRMLSADDLRSAA